MKFDTCTGFYLENFFFGGKLMSIDCMGGPAQSAKIMQREIFISKCTFEFGSKIN